MLYVGIDLGGTNIAAGVVDHSGILYNKFQIKTERCRGSDAVINDMALLANKVIYDAGLGEKEISGVGIGIPATMNAKQGIVYNCNYVNLGENSLITAFRKYLDLPVVIENDGNAAAWAEHICGSAKGTSDSITITLGTGIGGGIIHNNRIYKGFNGIAGEIGHMVIEANGLLCVCGRKGCWEEYASAKSLIRQAKALLAEHPESLMYELAEGDLEKMDAKIPFIAARNGDALGICLVNGYINNAATGISNLLSIFQPEVLSIGGGISNEGEYLIEPIRKKIYDEVYLTNQIPKTKIVRAHFKNDAGIIGAALLCSKPA